MSAIQPLCSLLEIDHNSLSKIENQFVEIELFTHIIEKLKEIIKRNNKEYFRQVKLDNKESHMIEENFLRFIISDIVKTGEYSLPGIAYYTDTPTDVIYELAAGLINNPSLFLTRKIIEIHRLVRPNLYQEIINKLLSKFSQ